MRRALLCLVVMAVLVAPLSQGGTNLDSNQDESWYQDDTNGEQAYNLIERSGDNLVAWNGSDVLVLNRTTMEPTGDSFPLPSATDMRTRANTSWIVSRGGDTIYVRNSNNTSRGYSFSYRNVQDVSLAPDGSLMLVTYEEAGGLLSSDDTRVAVISVGGATVLGDYNYGDDFGEPFLRGTAWDITGERYYVVSGQSGGPRYSVVDNSSRSSFSSFQATPFNNLNSLDANDVGSQTSDETNIQIGNGTLVVNGTDYNITANGQPYTDVYNNGDEIVYVDQLNSTPSRVRIARGTFLWEEKRWKNERVAFFDNGDLYMKNGSGYPVRFEQELAPDPNVTAPTYLDPGTTENIVTRINDPDGWTNATLTVRRNDSDDVFQTRIYPNLTATSGQFTVISTNPLTVSVDIPKNASPSSGSRYQSINNKTWVVNLTVRDPAHVRSNTSSTEVPVRVGLTTNVSRVDTQVRSGQASEFTPPISLSNDGNVDVTLLHRATNQTSPNSPESIPPKRLWIDDDSQYNESSESGLRQQSHSDSFKSYPFVISPDGVRDTYHFVNAPGNIAPANYTGTIEFSAEEE